MEIGLGEMDQVFRDAQAGRKSLHSPAARLTPSILQYDYLALSSLSADVQRLIAGLPQGLSRALDLGADKSPYRAALEARGLEVKTLDVTLDTGADYQGTVESTGLPDASFDVVLCTQVLEHCDDPFQGIREIRRILAPGGRAILSVPHVWFFHPHPRDHWRFTQQGLARLCQVGGLEPRLMLAQGGSLLAAAQVINFLAYGVLGRSGAPFYAAVNWAGRLADRAIPNPLFCHNFACLAEKPLTA
jgi:SAM-dependent methyltransferase